MYWALATATQWWRRLGKRTKELCFSPQQELLLIAFFRMTVNRVGRDMDGPSSSTPLVTACFYSGMQSKRFSFLLSVWGTES